MKFSVRQLWVIGVLCASACGSTQAATLQGKVTNATTGKPAASVEVILIELQGGMQPVANTKSDSQGQFTFDNPAIGAQPMLVRAVYKGVNFHQPLPPGKNSVEVNVYDLSGDAKTVTLVEIGGAKVIRGGNALASGPVDVSRADDIVAKLQAAGFAHTPEPVAAS